MKTTLTEVCRLGAAAALALLFAPSPAVEAQSFSEPGTVFYGKVLGTGSLQDFLITEGDLTWTILREDGTAVTLATTLYAYHDDTFSYRLDVPHNALALDTTATNGIPLPPSPVTHVHLSVTLDGESAALLGPAGTTFTVDQLRRTATYRLDLGVGRVATDTDGDGLPDWWEDLYGLDKQDPSDAGLDANSDGLTAADAYAQGLDPNRDARAPSLRTEELVVYPAGRTAILLDTADLDSAPATLAYTLTALPSYGQLLLRDAYANPGQPDAVLGVNDTFTQADVLAGRIVFDPAGGSGDPGTFGLEVTDDSGTHPADTGEVRLLAYTPAPLVSAELSAAEAFRLDLHGYADQGRLIMDGSGLALGTALRVPSAGLTGNDLAAYRSAYGDDASHVLAVPPGETGSATGGHTDDVLYAAASGTLAGGAGGDVFSITAFAGGRITVTDFDPLEGDVLDLSRLAPSPTSFADAYLKPVVTAGVVRLLVDADGDGAGYTNLVVDLPGLPTADADLYALAGSGALDLGALALEPRISIAAAEPQASENGPTAGRFTLLREGSLLGDVTAQLAISGSAANGSDYRSLGTTVVLPDGTASVDLLVEPFSDGEAEPAETVVAAVMPGTGYAVGPTSQATVTIDDLLMLVEVEVIEPVAVRDGGTAAIIAVTRRDVINRDVLIRLEIAGTASPGTDYATLASTVYLGVNQTVALLTVTPQVAAVLDGGMETVRVTVRPDAAYRIDGAGAAEVAIIEAYDTFVGWMTREFPGATDTPAELASRPVPGLPFSHLELYAYGIDPAAPDLSFLPTASIVDGRLEVRIHTPPDVTDVTYRVSGATDLVDPDAAPLALSPVGSGEPGEARYRADRTADEEPVGFGIIDLEWTP